MKLRVLGCSGGIGGRHMRTTSLLLDNDILIDAGTGVGDISLAELMLIDHIFITHSHLDHVCSIPFLVDTVGGMRNKPLTVHATEPTLEIIRNHIFNWSIWPDFTQIPTPSKPFMRYEALTLGETVEINGRKITSLPANHVVPSVGYHLDSGQASLVFTGDTTTHDPLWVAVNKITNLRYLIIEVAFCNRERELAMAAKHFCPSLLAEELTKLERSADIFITHLKPGEIELTMQEVEDCAGQYKPRMLQINQVFDF
ncbi:MAG: 3',5'-cyclic-nucleotide phosphodiesterase [Burkholderiales bacterium]|nr:3',5'-cyclic-nucleotide phosphodiesterase [Burkholderiales bacterium]